MKIKSIAECSTRAIRHTVRTKKDKPKNSKMAATVAILDRVCTEMGKQNSRTFPGLFSFFKNSISSQFCIKQHEKCTFSSRKRLSEKAHLFSLILIPVIKSGTTAQIV